MSLSDPARQRRGRRVLEDVLGRTRGRGRGRPGHRRPLAEIWESLAPEERLDLKLLSLLEHELTPEDVRLLAEVSRRSLEDDHRRRGRGPGRRCARKDAKHRERSRDELDSVWGWIVLRRRELQETDEKLRLMGVRP